MKDVDTNIVAVLYLQDINGDPVTGIAFNETNMDVSWYQETNASAAKTAFTPTNTGGDYDWTELGDGYYMVEIPGSGGATANNDTAGRGWVAGQCDGVMGFRSERYAITDPSDAAILSLLLATLSSGKLSTASFAAGAINAAAIATDAIGAAELAADAALEIADALLDRDWTAGTYTNSDAGGRTTLNALRSSRNRFTIGADGGDFVVFQEDDTAEAWKATGGVDRAPDLNPIIEINPD